MTFPCLMVRRDEHNNVSCGVESISTDDLPSGEVLIEVTCSSLNYKDALACQANPGIVRNLPHVPGIDCAGHVVESTSPDFRTGDAVIVTGYNLGVSHWGGYSAYVRVPADWVVALPKGLTLDDAMTYGTAGFTAAQCVAAIQHHGIQPDAGEVVVTGATGGVGSVAIAILSKLGYQVSAVTGKVEQTHLLEQLGARHILSRDDVNDTSGKTLLKSRWAAAVDTVGGNPLSTILRSISHRGCVAACGLAAGHDLPLTVYPFILRGVTLSGIDSAQCPRPARLEMWRRLANEWRIEFPENFAQTTTLSKVAGKATAMLAGETFGRTLVRPTA